MYQIHSQRLATPIAKLIIALGNHFRKNGKSHSHDSTLDMSQYIDVNITRFQ